MKRALQTSQALTLVELLVVVAIIALLLCCSVWRCAEKGRFLGGSLALHSNQGKWFSD